MNFSRALLRTLALSLILVLESTFVALALFFSCHLWRDIQSNRSVVDNLGGFGLSTLVVLLTHHFSIMYRESLCE
jgi:hypothetical protein